MVHYWLDLNQIRTPAIAPTTAVFVIEAAPTVIKVLCTTGMTVPALIQAAYIPHATGPTAEIPMTQPATGKVAAPMTAPTAIPRRPILK
jgi:hypothetical protein